DRQRYPVRINGRYALLSGALVSVWIKWGAGADQPNVVEERASERPLEEIVGKDIFLCNVPKGQRRSIIVPHHQRTAVGIGYKAIILAAIQLHLILIEKVPRTFCRHAEGGIEPIGIVDGKRLVRKMLSLRLGDRRRNTFSRKSAPNRRQFSQHRPIAV